jgi:hypothetical protein
LDELDLEAAELFLVILPGQDRAFGGRSVAVLPLPLPVLLLFLLGDGHLDLLTTA